jgi:hypothetical protein
MITSKTASTTITTPMSIHVIRLSCPPVTVRTPDLGIVPAGTSQLDYVRCRWQCAGISRRRPYVLRTPARHVMRGHYASLPVVRASAIVGLSTVDKFLASAPHGILHLPNQYRLRFICSYEECPVIKAHS